MNRFSMACLLALPLAFAACGKEGGTGPEPEPELVNTASSLIQDLARAWDTRAYDELTPLFAPDFRFLSSPNDVDFWLTPAEWGRTEELLCSQILFTGQRGTRPDGSPQSPVDRRFPLGLFLIAVDDDWVEQTTGSFAGTWYRLYWYTMTTQYENGDFDFIEGNAELYARIEDFTQTDGTPARRWVIDTFKDRGQPLPTFRHGVFSWGYLKGLYQRASP